MAITHRARDRSHPGSGSTVRPRIRTRARCLRIRKIQFRAYRFTAGFEAALQAFLDEPPQRGALLPSHPPDLLEQLVPEALWWF